MRHLFSVLLLVSGSCLYAIDIDPSVQWFVPKDAVISANGVPSQDQENFLYYKNSDGVTSKSFIFYEGKMTGLILVTGSDQSDTLESALVDSYGPGSNYGSGGKVWMGKDSLFVLVTLGSRVFLVTAPPRANDLKYVIGQIQGLPNLAK